MGFSRVIMCGDTEFGEQIKSKIRPYLTKCIVADTAHCIASKMIKFFVVEIDFFCSFNGNY